MTQTIGNPGTWIAQALGLASGAAADATREMGGQDAARPVTVNALTLDDLRAALRDGYADFIACRSDVMFLVLLYPVIGLVLVGMALQGNMLPLVFPLIAGFALLGPAVATGLYEISRRRAQGEAAGWGAAFSVFGQPVIGAVLALTGVLGVIFIAWMMVADALHVAFLGDEPYRNPAAFLQAVLGTGAGRAMIVVGCGVGALFAALVLAISVVSFPMLLDRRVGVPRAIATSLAVTRKNPGPVLAWGGVVTIGLILGSVPLLLGLVVALPVLGHATWHLYRRAVA